MSSPPGSSAPGGRNGGARVRSAASRRESAPPAVRSARYGGLATNPCRSKGAGFERALPRASTAVTPNASAKKSGAGWVGFVRAIAGLSVVKGLLQVA